MSYPGTPSGAGGFGSGFPTGLYPQPIGTLSGGSRPSGAAPGANTSSITTATAGMSIAGASGFPYAGPSSSTLPQQQIMPITTTPVGTAPRKQLAAAAAAGAAVGAAKSGRPKGPYKKAGGGASKRGGRGGGRGGRAGSALAGDDDDDKGAKDSDDDNEEEPEVSIEEQFILRLPPGEMCDRFREKVIAREIEESVKLKFTDARRGTFTFEGITFPTKLVDLPTIIEAQKTLNGKQMYKIADISQMLVVDETPEEKEIKMESAGQMPAPTLPPLKPSEYIWPDGLTNPLKNVRKRRFRKRVSKVAVEGVEKEIERLLQEDDLAEEVVYEIREQVDGMDRFDSDDGATPAPEGVQSDLDMDEADGEMMDMDEEEDEDEDEEDDQDDEDLLAELENAIGGGATDEEGGTPQPQNQAPTSQPSGVTSSHIIHSASSHISTHNVGPSGTGGIGGATGFTGLGDIRIAGGLTSMSAGASSAGANMVDKGKGKGKAQDDDEDEDDDEDDEEEEEEEEEEEDDEEDDSGSDEDDDDDDEDDKENAQVEKLLKDEIKELKGKIQENEDKLQSAPNEILKKRFSSIVEQLGKELELKSSQLEEARAKSKGK
ncbi:hypothetical protein BGX29_010264 [Mortierella sp. GBA35]|nr:hypothetical protein BGX29_010264 [Mortierella sp. GBA35]